MSAAPTIVVAGLGRCGSSLTMQMLHAGGMPCVGPFPAFEDERVRQRVALADVEAWRGQAVKVLDPQRTGLPGDVRVIWLDRDPKHQADSQAKFLRQLGELRADRATRRRIAQRLMVERAQALAVVGRRPVLQLTFEALLATPGACADRMAAFVRDVAVLDVDRMVCAVLPRSPRCQPDLRIELALIDEAMVRQRLGGGV